MQDRFHARVKIDTPLPDLWSVCFQFFLQRVVERLGSPTCHQYSRLCVWLPALKKDILCRNVLLFPFFELFAGGMCSPAVDHEVEVVVTKLWELLSYRRHHSTLFAWEPPFLFCLGHHRLVKGSQNDPSVSSTRIRRSNCRKNVNVGDGASQIVSVSLSRLAVWKPPLPSQWSLPNCHPGFSSDVRVCRQIPGEDCNKIRNNLSPRPSIKGRACQ